MTLDSQEDGNFSPYLYSLLDHPLVSVVSIWLPLHLFAINDDGGNVSYLVPIKTILFAPLC